jgi:hypothetical protein
MRGRLPFEPIEEVPVRGIQIPQGLLQHHGRYLAEPTTLAGLLRVGGQQLRQVPGLGERRTLHTGGLTSAKRIVADHPRAPERPCQRGTLGTVRVQAEAVPELHDQHRTLLVYG